MAYAYPSGDLGGSSSSLDRVSYGQGQGYHPLHTGTGRKASDPGHDVLREFKHILAEDEHYISFFQERIRVEEQYIESLTRLYDRSVAIDTLHDDAGPRKSQRSTTRRAWQEVRDYTQREVQSREAMVGALREDVVKELVKLKEEQMRIRGVLKDNVKLANEMYEDHAKYQLPKLKKAYYQKCQALEDHKRQEHAIAMQARLLSTPSPPSPANTPLHEHPFAANASAGNPLNPNAYTSPPTATPPLPPMSNPVASQPYPAAHGQAGSASGGAGESKGKDVLNDIAAQSRKGFSAFMQKLGGDKDKEKDRDDGGFTIGGGSGGGNDGDGGLQRRGTGAGNNQKALGAMRGVKAKREADEADKAYRMGVFHLESLRLRREKLQQSAMTSLETFNDELGNKLRYSLESYVDAIHGTAATNAQATEVARAAIEGINTEQDIMLFRARLRAINSMPTAPVPYENFYVGPCRSLIFGVSLTDYDFTRGEGSDHGRPPAIIEKAIQAIDERGLDSEGIYRVSGRHANVQKMIQGIELDEEKFRFNERDDVFSIGNILKQYLRELPEPVFPLPHPERVKYTESRESHIESNFSTLRARLRRLPPIHQTTFQAMIEHLGRVNQHSANNKMDAKNLAVLFNSVLFGQDQLPTDSNTLMMHHQGKDTVLEDLITFSDLLFGVDSPAVAPTALPPGPALSRSGVLSYHPVDEGLQPGSSRTKIKISQPGSAPAQGQSGGQTPKSALGTNEPGTAKPATVAQMEEPLSNMVGGRNGFTPDDQLDLLFDPKHIPATLRDGLPEDVHVRPLASTDLLRSHFQLLNTLRESPALAPSVYAAIFSHFKSCLGTYYVLVMVDKSTDQLVASGTLILERKHINNGGASGHLEDIVVSDTMQGKGLGLRLVVGLRDMAVALGCYKVILDCKEQKIPFYEKCGFYKRSAGMAYYVADHPEADATKEKDSSDQQPSASGSGSGSGAFGLMASLASGVAGAISSIGGESAQPSQTIASPSAITPSEGRPDLTMATSPETTAESGDGTGDGAVQSPSSPTFTSASSGTGVTYSFPTETDQAVLPPWAAEGLGSSPLVSPIASTTNRAGAQAVAFEGAAGAGDVRGESQDDSPSADGARSQLRTPLPPGAAPASTSAEPERQV
ncbi:hypothetical protein I317_05929 [Kwoniella heveanensis CBS 569]|nr:hypothetical protein I317_05929 [Kwoniella heveanensis CBS 569]